MLAADTENEGQPRFHLGDVDVQRRCAVQQVVDGRVVGVTGVGQVAPGDQPGPGSLPGVDGVLDRPEPAGHHAQQETRLRGAGLVAAGLAQGQDALQRAVPDGVVAAHHHSGEGGAARRADEGSARPLLQPDSQCLVVQPRECGVVGDVASRLERVDHPGGGEQRRVGELRPSQVIGGVGGVQPPVQMPELAIELGGEAVRCRDVEAELAQ